MKIQTEWLSLSISCLAFVVSALTAWLTFFRRGKLRMTQPTVVYFGPDGGGEKEARNKVYLRTLLYSTSRRGQMVESMHVNLQRAETRQNFSVWVYGEERLVRGSGLFVGHEGVAFNHHFLLPRDGADFKFVAGEYALRVNAKRVGDRRSRELAAVRLVVSDSHALELQQKEEAGIYFDWGADLQAYHPSIKIHSKVSLPKWLLEAAG
jgi:hypothetical protein